MTRFWPNVQKLVSYELEYEFATKIVPLPCDQRYGEKEMKFILNVINSILKL